MPVGERAAEVLVLLSTFNGSAFLPAQLDSLRAQDHPGTRVLARDDGSTDGTVPLLLGEQAAGRLVLMPDTRHLGAAGSFLTLLAEAARTHGGPVAFCDQDDVWLPHKLSRALDLLGSDPAPRLYCARAQRVDATLRPLGVTPDFPLPGFGNALVENPAIGCTMVLNAAAVTLIARALPREVPVHDWWCYLVVSALGTVVWDPEPCILYRQHGGNAFGAPAGLAGRLARAVRRFHAPPHWPAQLAAEFLSCHGERASATMRALAGEVVRSRASWRARAKLALSSRLWRQRPMDTAAMRLMWLAGRY